VVEVRLLAPEALVAGVMAAQVVAPVLQQLLVLRTLAVAVAVVTAVRKLLEQLAAAV
jgi:hypothetical protein